MGRISDTRQRTRLAAAQLVAAGQRPHDLTVDLIYAEIRQGSRTTINEELKLWKNEQAKTHALGTSLPTPVVNAMLAAWAAAVEQGEQVFDERRAAVEGELAQALVRSDAAQSATAQAQSEIAALKEQLDQARASEAQARVDAQREREIKDEALQKTWVIEQRLSGDLRAATSRFEIQREAYEQQLREQQMQLAASQAQLREELARATERLEGVQKHVLLQVAEAREAQKRAELALTKAVQRNEQLASDLESRRAEVVALTTQLQRTTQDHAAAAEQLATTQADREDLAVRLASTSGRLEAVTQQVADLMTRLAALAHHTQREPRRKKRSMPISS